MKPRNFALALTAAALLSTLVYASDNTDTISSSFEQARKAERYMLVAMASNDPFVIALSTTGWDKADQPHYQ